MRHLYGTLLLTLVLLTTAAFAADPPDSAVNPVTGDIESVDSTLKGASYDIRHTVDDGQQLESTDVTTTSDDDHSPRLCIRPNGDTGVVWWREQATDAIQFRGYDLSGQAWGDVETVSGTDASRNPSIGCDAGGYWLGYESDAGAGDTDIVVQGVIDQGDPILTAEVVDTTDYTGAVDVVMNVDSGSVWVTWVDSGTDVGWSEYDDTTETWGLPAYESYAADSIKAARARIEDAVLGP